MESYDSPTDLPLRHWPLCYSVFVCCIVTPQGQTMKTPSETTHTTLRLPIDLLEDIRQHAELDDRSVSSFIRLAIRQALEHRAEGPRA